MLFGTFLAVFIRARARNLFATIYPWRLLAALLFIVGKAVERSPAVKLAPCNT
jgi:hypothetical protein